MAGPAHNACGTCSLAHYAHTRPRPSPGVCASPNILPTLLSFRGTGKEEQGPDYSQPTEDLKAPNIFISEPSRY